MALRKLSFVVAPGDADKRLDQFLAEALPSRLGEPISKTSVKRLIADGGVYLNRHRVRIASKLLRQAAQIEVYLDLAALKDPIHPGSREWVMTAERVLFEDEYLIAVDKPPGLPTQATLNDARNNLYESVRKFLAARNRVSAPYLGLHQRLDRDTSGVILLTKRKEANAGIAAAFAAHAVRKIYLALTARPAELPPDAWTVSNHLGRMAGRGGASPRFAAVGEGGDFAQTDFRLLEALGRALLIESRPLTGRTHQIRVHLSESGLPILGDRLYGDHRAGRERASEISAPRQMLHAASLSVVHPLTRAEISVVSPLPADFEQFRQSLKSALGSEPGG